jgi:glycosyltransferase involved in cell wall biosynthesis
LPNPLLSIIIPAYNEEVRLPNTLGQVTTFLNTQTYLAEVLVVENGSHDRTLEIARDFSQRFSYVKAMHVDSRGKGLAVRYGMQKATGAYRFICDADLSMPIQEVNRFIPPELPVMDIAIASREAPGAVRYNEPLYRHLTGRFFNLVVRLLALPGLQDTQCGFKCFRGAVADEIFPLQTINGWSFDVEVLFIARQRGYKIVEIPVPWYFSAESKVRIFHDLYKVGLDLLAIRRNAWNGKYKT